MLTKEEKEYLEKLLVKLSRAKKSALYSYKICKKIGVKKRYTEDEKDRFEALISKFVRLSDIILNQAIKTIEIFELNEAPATIRDAISAAEKRGIIESESKFIEIRKKRNLISHEYLVNEKEILEIFSYILDNIYYLFNSVDKILNYCKKW